MGPVRRRTAVLWPLSVIVAVVLAVIGFEAFFDPDERAPLARLTPLPPEWTGPLAKGDSSTQDQTAEQVSRTSQKKPKQATRSTTTGSASGSGSTSTSGQKGSGSSTKKSTGGATPSGSSGGGSSTDGTGGSSGGSAISPTSISCGLVGVASVDLSWAPIAGATSYTLHYGEAGSRTVEVTGTSYALTTLIADGTAWVVVNVGADSSARSNTVSYTVAAVSLCS